MTFFQLPTVFFICIQLFRERLSEKMCTRQSPKKIWDMINTWFLTTAAVEHTFVAFLEHSQRYVRGLKCHFFKFLWRTKHPKPPTIPFGTVTCTFSDNLSRNSCIPLFFRTFSLVTKAQAWEKHTINLFFLFLVHFLLSLLCLLSHNTYIMLVSLVKTTLKGY